MTRYARALAVTFLSASTLAYEILLVRVFAIEQFHHFAYMAISIAMLGFGTSGTWLALVRPQVEAGALVPVLDEYCEPFPGFFLYFPRRRHRSAALRALIDFVRKEVRV